jgi:uncharacterized repeat protein (TIGR04076 family)
MRQDDRFELYDLRVEVVAGERPMVCNHKEGDYFELRGENLSFPAGQSFPLYPLAALLPLLPAKQRRTHRNDWMTSDAEIACPDPHCGARFRITRTATSAFRHSEVTRVPLAAGGESRVSAESGEAPA